MSCRRSVSDLCSCLSVPGSEYAVTLVAVEVADGFAYFSTEALFGPFPQNAAATVDDSVFVGNLGHFILVVSKGQVGSILEILSEPL